MSKGLGRFGRWAGVGLACAAMACGGTSSPVEQQGAVPLPGTPVASFTEAPRVTFPPKLPVELPEQPEEPVEPEQPEEPAPTFPKRCPDIYSDDVLQVMRVEITEADWAKLQYEHKNADAMRAAGQPVEVYRPLTKFEHNGRTTTDAMIRLRGNPSFWYKQDKMQFQISFNENNKDGRFRGLRKIVLDSAHYNFSYLRDRVAMSVLRDVGVPAPCVNHARLYVNGQYYGLYANIEKVDREFLERNFPDPGGNLWKKGSILKTNEDENPDTSANRAFWRLETIDGFEAVGDVDNATLAWAAEAVFPDADGYWAGGWNFYWYEDPARGFVYVPWDIDLAFENLPYTTDPLTWHKPNDNFHGRPHVDLVFGDPARRMKFVDAVETVLSKSSAKTLRARIDKWAAQIEDAAREDPYPPFSFTSHKNAVTRMRDYIQQREDALEGWVDCARAKGGNSTGCM